MDSFTVAWEADKSSGHDFEVKEGNYLHMLHAKIQTYPLWRLSVIRRPAFQQRYTPYRHFD